jgi:hypothetical protein
MVARLNEGRNSTEFQVSVRGSLCPFCRQMYNERLAKHDGDWAAMVEQEVKVYRLILSEQDRVGIGTFQPKDEKNQDSTELTGDINYRKIAEYGTDSDPRCVVADTMVATGDGLRAMGRLLPFRAEADTFTPLPLAVSSAGASKVAHSDSVYSAGPQPLRTIETRLGYRLTGSPAHMVLTLPPDGVPAWKQLRLVEEGDFVALGRGVHTWPEQDMALPERAPDWYGNERQRPSFPTRMTPALARFLGLWIGDGHFYVVPEKHQYELGWTQKEPERRAEFVRLLADLFGVSARDEEREGHAGVVRVGSRALVRWLQEVVGVKAGARSKEIPEAVLRSSRPTVLACLQGLWETDGTIRCREDGSNWAMFATCSETLARQVHLCLLAFGVVAPQPRGPEDPLQRQPA